MSERRTIAVVKTDKGCFVTYRDKKRINIYGIDELLFNGKKADKTYHEDWFYVEEYPTTIQIEKAGDKINERFELVDKTVSGLPEVIDYVDKDKYSENVLDNLYLYNYDRGPRKLVDYECDIEVVLEVENFKLPPKIEYEGLRTHKFKEVPYTISNADVKHQLLDEIIFPKVLLHERPCKFTSKQMFDITRKYVLENIDSSVARVTQNYDTCFAVAKIIPLIVPEKIEYYHIFARTKRERNKVHTRIKEYDEKEIFAITHSQANDKNYDVIEEMCANSEEELKAKVDEWLTGLMELINEPLHQCPNCNGTGYIAGKE